MLGANPQEVAAVASRSTGLNTHTPHTYVRAKIVCPPNNGSHTPHSTHARVCRLSCAHPMTVRRHAPHWLRSPALSRRAPLRLWQRALVERCGSGVTPVHTLSEQRVSTVFFVHTTHVHTWRLSTHEEPSGTTLERGLVDVCADTRACTRTHTQLLLLLLLFLLLNKHTQLLLLFLLLLLNKHTQWPFLSTLFGCFLLLVWTGRAR